MVNRIVITGGCGFIGHHACEHIFVNTDWEIIILDKLTYASMGYERLRDAGLLNSDRVKIYTHDLTQPLSVGLKREIGTVDYMIHFAAETHVDNSIETPVECIKNNVMSAVNILEFAREQKSLKLLVIFSTDEVYGAAPEGVSYKEWDCHRPTNPYSASKSATDNIAIGYENTYKVPLIIVNVMNAYGERQHVEKFIPLCIKKVLKGEKIDIHSNMDKTVSGGRYYIHARNIASGVLFLMLSDKTKIGDKYNITGEREVSNLEMAKFIANTLEKPLNYEMVNSNLYRAGHDLFYRLDGSKLAKMGWEPPVNFEESLRKTIKWTVSNPKWLEDFDMS